MLEFAPIMPAFCSLLLPSYYSNNFAGKINASLIVDYFDWEDMVFLSIPIPLSTRLLNDTCYTYVCTCAVCYVYDVYDVYKVQYKYA